MNVDRIVHTVAGTLILLSLTLTYLHSHVWVWLTVFVGANLLQSAFTGFCPLAIILRKAGLKPGPAF